MLYLLITCEKNQEKKYIYIFVFQSIEENGLRPILAIFQIDRYQY